MGTLSLYLQGRDVLHPDMRVAHGRSCAQPLRWAHDTSGHRNFQSTCCGHVVPCPPFFGTPLFGARLHPVSWVVTQQHTSVAARCSYSVFFAPRTGRGLHSHHDSYRYRSRSTTCICIGNYSSGAVTGVPVRTGSRSIEGGTQRGGFRAKSRKAPNFRYHELCTRYLRYVTNPSASFGAISG